MSLKAVIDRIQITFPRLIVRIVFMFVVLLVFGVINEDYLSWNNILMVITRQAPYYTLLAFGMTMAILLGGIDLSIGSVMTLASCVCAILLKTTGNVPLAVITSLLSGAAIGVINAFLITKIRLPPFIATYGMDWVVKGTIYILMGGLSIFAFPESFRRIGTGSVAGIPNIFIIMLLILVILLFLFHKTTFGNRFYAAARNRSATRLAGISTTSIVAVSYIITGLLASITGMLYISNLNAVEASLGEGWNLKLIAITLIGGTQMEGGVGTVANTAIGALIYLFIMNGLNTSGISANWQDAIVGALVVLSVLVEFIGQKIKERKKNKKAMSLREA